MTINEIAVHNFITKNGRPPEMKNVADQEAIWFLIREEHRSRGENFPCFCWKYAVSSAIISYWRLNKITKKA